MPRKFHNVRQSFSRGVITPRLSARVGLDGYDDALKSCKNFIITSQGGAVMREGGQFLGYPKDGLRFRIFQFLRGGEQSDILVEVTPGGIRFWHEVGGTPTLYPPNDTDEFLPNPYTDSDLDDLYFVNQDRFGVLCSGQHPPLYLSFKKDGTIESELYPVEKIIDYDYNDLNSPKFLTEESNFILTFSASWRNMSTVYTVAVGGVHGDIWERYVPGVAFAETNRTNIEAMIVAAYAKYGVTLTPGVDLFVVTLNEVDGSYSVKVTGPQTWRLIRIVARTEDYGDGGKGGHSTHSTLAWEPISQPYEPNPQTLGVGAQSTILLTSKSEPVWSYPFFVLHNGNYYQCIDVHAKATANEPGVGAEWQDYWVDLGTTKPTGYDYSFPSGNNWGDIPTGYVIIPRDRGFPTVAAFHEQRLVLMANKDNPTAVYGSAIGEYQNFLIGVNDDQAWMFVLDSTDSPQIKWAVSDENLLIGTSSGDWIVTAEITITPTDIRAERQNAARSKLAKPVQIDKETFYIEQGGRKMRSTSYVRERGAFTSLNISVLTEELVSTPGLVRLAVQHSPETMITLTRKDGQMLFMAYEPVTNITAMSEYETDGEVFDLATYFNADFNWDYTYMAVKRNDLWMLERMRYPNNKQGSDLIANGVVMVDSWVSGQVPSSGIISGLDHLEGKTVFLTVDDGWEVGIYTVLEGQISTNRYSGTYAVGLPYTASLETFEVEDNFQGTGLGAKRRWNSLSTRLLNSALPKVYGQRDRDRTPSTPMGDYEGVREGLQDIEQAVSGYGDGAIIVEQDRPYPTHIVAFFGEYQVEDR